MARRKWSQISLAMLLVVVTAFALLFGWNQPERPPRPMVPATEHDKHILKLANGFLAAKGVSDYVPVRIVPTPNRNGTVTVIYWTPKRELQMLGDRAVIVNPETKSVEFVMRD